MTNLQTVKGDEKENIDHVVIPKFACTTRFAITLFNFKILQKVLGFSLGKV